MGVFQSKTYNVEKNQKGVDRKPSTATKKYDTSTIQTINEAKKHIDAANQMMEGVKEEIEREIAKEIATASKIVGNKLSVDPENETKVEPDSEELSVKTPTSENEAPIFEKIAIKPQDEPTITTKVAESAKIESFLSVTEDNGNNKDETIETKKDNLTIASAAEETEKEKQDLLNEITKIEEKSSDKPEDVEEKSLTQENRNKEIIDEMIKATVNPKKHEVIEDNKITTPKDEPQPRNVSESFTIEENEKKGKECENKINVAVDENIKKIEDLQKLEEIQVVEGRHEVEDATSKEIEIMEKEDKSKTEVKASILKTEKVEICQTEIKKNEDKLQNEIKPDSKIQEVAFSEGVKKKVEFEIPSKNKTAQVAQSTNAVNEIKVDKHKETSEQQRQEEEIVVQNSTEENQFMRKVEEQDNITTDKVVDVQEPNQENNEMEKNTSNEEIKVDVEVHKIKETNQVNNKIEESISAEVCQEPIVEKKDKAENIKKIESEESSSVEDKPEENIQEEKNTMEESISVVKEAEDPTPIVSEINQGSTSEIAKSNTEEKAKQELEKPSVSEETASKPVAASEEKEDILKEQNLPSTEIAQVTESRKLSQGQTTSHKENFISNEIDPTLQKIQEIEEEAKGLKEQIIHFTGTTNDVTYAILNEALIKNMLKLDDLIVENNDEIRNERKRVIKFVQECLNTLERNVEKGKDDDDSD